MFLPECVFVESDFCCIPDQMNFNHTWKSAPKRGLAVLSEDSKEEESDREVIMEQQRTPKYGFERIVDKARGIPRSQLLPPIEAETPNRKRKRLGIILIFIILFILIICGAYRLYSHILPRYFAPQQQKIVAPSAIASPPLLENRISCSNYTLLGHNDNGQYFYSVEIQLPMKKNFSKEAYGFYKPFSESGKQLESIKIWEQSGNQNVDDGDEIMWIVNQTGRLENELLVDYYEVTLFLKNDTSNNSQFVRRMISVHCPEKEIRKIVEETEQQEEKVRQAWDERLIQVLIHILSFVLGLIVSKLLPM